MAFAVARRSRRAAERVLGPEYVSDVSDGLGDGDVTLVAGTAHDEAISSLLLYKGGSAGNGIVPEIGRRSSTDESAGGRRRERSSPSGVKVGILAVVVDGEASQ